MPAYWLIGALQRELSDSDVWVHVPSANSLVTQTGGEEKWAN